MKAIRTSATLALAGVLALTTAGVARDEAPAASTQNGQTRSIANENLLRKFVGEWEGRLEMRRDDRASISIVSVSSRFDTDHGRLEAVTQGFAFGKPFEGAEMFALDEDGKPAKYWWTADLNQKGSSWTWQIGEDARSIVGKGREHQGSLATRYEHILRWVDDDRYEAEWFTIEPNGERTRVARMTLDRMHRGERADASEKFEDGSFESWSTSIKGAHAQVRDD